jgi:hypothetical protein
VLWRLKHFTSWASAAWRLLEHAEGIYIPYFVYTSFILFLFEWIFIGGNIHTFGEASR